MLNSDDYFAQSLDPLDFDVSLEATCRPQDDGGFPVDAHMRRLLEAITLIGGEVSRLRAEVDGLLEQNSNLVGNFEKLRDVIEAKGELNLDEFELACEVMDIGHGPIRRLTH